MIMNSKNTIICLIQYNIMEVTHDGNNNSNIIYIIIINILRIYFTFNNPPAPPVEENEE